jgi:hypothetical protein
MTQARVFARSPVIAYNDPAGKRWQRCGMRTMLGVQGPVLSWLAAIVLVAALTRPVHAEPTEQPAPLPGPATPTQGESDPAWLLYQAATLALAEGDRAQALQRLEQLAAEFPGHPATRLAIPLRLTLERPREPEEGPETPEHATRTARAELVSFQTMAGLVAGATLCEATGCQSARTTVLTFAVTSGTALGLSLLGTQDGITPGATLAIDSGTAWGIWHGGALNTITYTDPTNFTNQSFDDRDHRTGRFFLGGQLLGTGAGLAVAMYGQPHAGQVSLATSGGIWSGALAALALNAMDFRGTDAQWLTTLLVASDLGLGAGAFVSTKVATSRSRMLLIDSAGLLGMLLGMGLDVAVEGQANSQGRLFGAGLAGTLAGLGTGVYLTRHWDVPELASALVTPALQPVPGGAMLSLSGRF